MGRAGLATAVPRDAGPVVYRFGVAARPVRRLATCQCTANIGPARRLDAYFFIRLSTPVATDTSAVRIGVTSVMNSRIDSV